MLNFASNFGSEVKFFTPIKRESGKSTSLEVQNTKAKFYFILPTSVFYQA